MNPHEIKIQIQKILGDGLVVIVGCGLSSAEGLPGMYDLSEHLISTLPSRVPTDAKKPWAEIEKSLVDGNSLEQALAGRELPRVIYEVITHETARFIEQAERSVFSKVLSGQKSLRFSSLAQVFPPSPNGICILTTNYDRLVEFACEAEGLCVDSMFVGNSIGRYHPKESAYSFCRGIRRRQGKIFLEYANRIRVLKPHGSLDWYIADGRPVRCPYNVDLHPLIIPPGETKYRAGYEEPFDVHREHANREIDRAKRYLIIGYGFNDDHLQTHLNRNLRDGKPCLVVTRDLSAAASALINESPNMMALSADSDNEGVTRFRDIDGTYYNINGNLWDLGKLVEEVFI